MANTYRLYNEDVKEGLVDFDDQKYHALKTTGDYTLIFNDHTDQFIVAYRVEYHELGSIDWAQGHYFDDVLEATKFLEGKTNRVSRFLFNPESLSEGALDLIWNTMMEARHDGNIRETDVESMLALTIDFILDNPELFDEETVQEIQYLVE